MAYLSTFEHDIFISYARVDDQADSPDEPGWVTRFCEYLERRLSQRFGRRGSVTIWRDTREMGGTTFFDDAIERAIKGSAVFLALNSRGYLSVDSYCGKELDIFHRKAQAEPYGLKVNSQSRIFNLLIQNISHKQWPPEMQGTAGLPFHDAETPEGRGWPSPHSSERFERQLRQLVDELELMLGALRNEEQVSVRRSEQQEQQETGSGLTVFLGHTEGALRRVSRRISEELRQKGVNVVSEIPPPRDAAGHKDNVETAVRNADLAVHLLDDEPGEELEDAPGKFFSREQVELVRGLKKPQIVCVTKMPEGQEVADWEDEVYKEHRDYVEQLGRLDGEGRGQNSYTFIRDTPGAFPREVLAQIDRIVATRRPPTPTPGQHFTSSALLDTHPKDMRYVLDLSPVLDERNIDINLVSAKGEPQKGMSLFEESLKTVSVLIIVFGQVKADWVKERLNYTLQIVTSEKYPLRLCCIYAPPDERGAARQFAPGGIPTRVPTFRIDRPEFLGSLLDNYIGFAAPHGGNE